MTQEVHRTFCRICSSNCGVLVTVDSDRVVSVRGDPDHPASEGYVCSKGRALGRAHHHPDRFDVPLLGRPPARHPVRLPEILDDLTRRLDRIRADRGPDSIGIYLGTQGHLESGAKGPVLSLVAALGTRSYYSAVTVDNVAELAAGIRLTGGTSTVMPELDRTGARFVLVLGRNPVVSHSIFRNPLTMMRRMLDRGCKVWVVDPRRSETAQMATRHLMIRPNTDAFLLAFVIRELLHDGADWAYLDAHAAGVDRLRSAVEPHTLELTARRTGLDRADLTELVDSIRDAGVVGVVSGTGPRMGPHPSATAWLVFAVSIVTGSFDRAGGTLLTGRGLWGAPPGAPAEAPGPASRPELTRWAGQTPCVALADEIEAGHLRALLCFGGNPASALPDQGRVRAALGQLEVFAVHDIVPTASTDLATHVLPGTSELEHGCASFPGRTTDGRRLFTDFAPGVFEPSADRRHTWWYVRQIGSRLGLDGLESVTEPQPFDGSQATGGPSGGPVLGTEAGFGTFVDTLPDRRWQLAPPELVAQLAAAEEPPTLTLIPRRQKRHVNGFLADVDGPGGVHDDPVLVMNTGDARERGVADGAVVHATSATGQMTLRASVTDDIAPGAVSIPHGFDRANVNLLTSSTVGVDPFSGMPLLCGVELTVEPALEPNTSTPAE
jgi:anaerobic selenocysteine-containing dehydrogenase